MNRKNFSDSYKNPLKKRWKVLSVCITALLLLLFFNLRIDLKPIIANSLKEIPVHIVSSEEISCTPSGRLKIKNTVVSYKGKQTITLSIKSGNAGIRIFGLLFSGISIDSIVKGKIHNTAKFISNADICIEKFTADFPVNHPLSISNINIDADLKPRADTWLRGRIKIKQAKYMEIKTGPFTSDFSGSPDVFRIKNIRGKFLHGRLNSDKIEIDLNKKRFSGCRLMIKDIDPGGFISPLREKKGIFTASAKTDILLHESYASLDSIKGEIKIDLTSVKFTEYLRFNDRVLVSIAMKNRPLFSFTEIHVSGNLNGCKPFPVEMNAKGNMTDFSGSGRFNPITWDMNLKISGILKENMEPLIRPQIWNIMPADSLGRKEFSGSITGKLYSPLISMDSNYKRRAVKGFIRRIFKR